MREFLKFTLASMVGTFLIGIVLIIFFAVAMAMAIGGALSSGMTMAGGKATRVKDNSVLLMRLDQEIVDRGSADNFNFDFGPFTGEGKLGLNDALDNLEKAKRDDRIKGIFLDLTLVQARTATLKEIRDKLIEFRKESGKPVIAYSEFYTQGSYYLASAADQIYLTPEGDLDFRGLQAELMFFKGLFDKLDIDVEFIKGSNNIYKSFGESYTEDRMTDANHEQIRALLHGIWDHYLSSIAETRNIDKAELNGIADSLRVRYASDAVTLGLIDGVKYKDEVLALLKEKMDLPADKDIEMAEFSKYTKAYVAEKKDDDEKGSAGREETIAVVYAQGGIGSGEGDEESIGSETLSEAIREAREDSSVKAIVLRVNSPGGSGLASDVIWREVDLARQAKPVVVSMGDVAASGGYYISCAANKIYAEPTTITGSIGVFGIIPNFQGFFNNKLGITFDGDKTNAYADMFNVDRPLRADERRIIQEYVDHFYSTFKQRVANGRHLSVEQVDEVGRGRVWTGIDAKERGLVDELGGLEDAIKGAAALANLSDYDTKDYPEQKDILTKLLEDLNAQSRSWVKQQVFGDDIAMLKQFEQLRQVKAMSGIQARMPFEMDIH